MSVSDAIKKRNPTTPPSTCPRPKLAPIPPQVASSNVFKLRYLDMVSKNTQTIKLSGKTHVKLKAESVAKQVGALRRAKK